ncbi:Hypothetical protein R9X50_00158400 [Acrodontium crateriforme]|uniref:Uncharacterized protein n=1 Tax=Acrodontium crateriforme TaxID=150365 RepID=A0AAQ3LZB4_9PEZI|nr:Hypothetical protein R9X50_00158400 [Acrodontium crateriforme]
MFYSFVRSAKSPPKANQQSPLSLCPLYETQQQQQTHETQPVADSSPTQYDSYSSSQDHSHPSPQYNPYPSPQCNSYPSPTYSQAYPIQGDNQALKHPYPTPER